jgi:hypothetical protein
MLRNKCHRGLLAGCIGCNIDAQRAWLEAQKPGRSGCPIQIDRRGPAAGVLQAFNAGCVKGPGGRCKASTCAQKQAQRKRFYQRFQHIVCSELEAEIDAEASMPRSPLHLLENCLLGID